MNKISGMLSWNYAHQAWLEKIERFSWLTRHQRKIHYVNSRVAPDATTRRWAHEDCSWHSGRSTKNEYKRRWTGWHAHRGIARNLLQNNLELCQVAMTMWNEIFCSFFSFVVVITHDYVRWIIYLGSSTGSTQTTTVSNAEKSQLKKRSMRCVHCQARSLEQSGKYQKFYLHKTSLFPKHFFSFSSLLFIRLSNANPLWEHKPLIAAVDDWQSTRE